MRSRRIVYYICLILSLILISCFGGAVSYGLFFCVVLIPVISYIYLITVYFCFRIYQKIESRDVISNSPKDYYFILKNESFISFASVSVSLFSTFSTIEELPDDTEFSLVRGEQYRYDTRIICKYRGEYEVGIKEITLTDFLRLFRLKYKMPSTIKALVTPRLIEMPSIKGLSDVTAQVARESLFHKDEMDTVVRDYVAGDPVRNINWKLTAKEGQLKTRIMTGEEKKGIVLLADTRRYSNNNIEYLPLEDQMLKLLLAVSLYFANKGIPIRVIYQQAGIQTFDVTNLKAFNEFYNQVSAFVFDERYSFENLLDCPEAKDSQVLIALYHEEGDELKLAELADRGNYVISYVVSDNPKTSETTSRNRKIYVPVNCDIEEVLQ